MNKLKSIKFLDVSIYSFLIIVLGNVLMVLGINLFLVPAGVFPTGFTGISFEISMLLSYIDIHVQYNIIAFLLNVPIIIFGFFKIGNKFVIKTILSVLIFTTIASIIPTDSTLITINSSGDMLICAIISAILMGSGIGLMLKVGASSGGTDIIAVYMSVYKGKSFGLYNLVINAFVILIALVMTQDIIIASLSLINLYILNAVVDSIHNSQEKRLMVIFTSHGEEVTNIMKENIFRGITILDSMGGYSKTKNSTLLISVSQGEVEQAIRLIKEVDPNSFINVLKSDKIAGNFENPYQKML